MTPELTLRSFSDDQYVLDKVFYSNSYRLLPFDSSKNSTVIDIGAHCGYFVFAAHILGAKKIYAFEPFLDNFRILIKNTEQFPRTILNHQIGVYPESTNVKFCYPKPNTTKTLNFSKIGIDEENSDYHVAPCVTLDEILAEYVKEDTIEILKINIGYAEDTILMGSNLIGKKVENICGEVDLTEQTVVTFRDKMAAKGYVDAYFIRNPEEPERFGFVMSRTKCEKFFKVLEEKPVK